MKKNSLLFILISLGLILGCSDDDGNESAEPGGINKTPNLQAVGDSAHDILSNDDYRNLLIEIAYVEGFRPTNLAMGIFEAFLRERTFKENIRIEYNLLPSPNQESLTIQEVANLEDEHRTAFNDGDTLAIYIYFADAPDETDDEEAGVVTLGSVYRNTSMVIYESTVRDLDSKSLLVTLADVESATLNHEFGHLFGLVDIGSPPVNEHEGVQLDEEGNPVLDGNGNPVGNNHCDVDGCLMRAELQFGVGIMGMLETMKAKGQSIPILDAECILDLQANGGR